MRKSARRNTRITRAGTAMALSQLICHVTHVTIIESPTHSPYYYKLTEQQFGAAQCLAASRPITVHTISCL